MVTKKLLIGGTAAVGSVATVAVVANQFGKPSDSREANPTSTNTGQGKVIVPRKKSNREKVVDWLDSKKTEGKNWQIKIKDNYSGTIQELTEDNSTKLSDYLTKNDELLKSITSGTDTTFTFKNVNGDWENVFTDEQVDTWVDNTFKDTVNLKLVDGDQTKEITSIDDLKTFLKPLENKETLFTHLSKNTPSKTILLEKYSDYWRRTKTEIEAWRKIENFEIKIKKGDENPKTLNEMEEVDLVGLTAYFSSADNYVQLTKYKSGKKIIILVLKKEDADWKIIYDEAAINNWIDIVSDKKAKLKIYEGETEKNLSEMENNKDELRQLFEAITEERSPFRKKLEGYDEENQKILIFEKYTKSYEHNESWTHVKEALDDLIADLYWKINLDRVEIQVGENPKENKKIKEVEDDKLIGLLKYMESKKEEYKKWFQDNNEGKIVIKKNEKGEWQEIKREPHKA